MDCSSNSFKNQSYRETTPIPAMRPNQTVSFFCSINYFSSNLFNTFPILNINFSANLSNILSNFYFNQKQKKAILKFNYTVPSDLKQAFSDHDKKITCSPVEENTKTNIEIIETDKRALPQCLFRLNIDFKPFIDESVSTNQMQDGYTGLVECPIRARPNMYKIRWLVVNERKSQLIKIEKEFKNKREYLTFDANTLLNSNILYAKCVLIHNNLPLISSKVTIYMKKTCYFSCLFSFCLFLYIVLITIIGFFLLINDF